MAEHPLRAARCVRAQPRADINGQGDPPIDAAGQLLRGDRELQALDTDCAATQPVVQRTVTAPMLGAQRQVDKRPDRARGTQHRIGQLEQRIRPSGQALVELATERGKITDTGRTGFPGHPAYCTLEPTATASCLQVLSKEPEDDHAVAAPYHGDTPHKINDSGQIRPGRLNAKLKVGLGKDPAG